MNHIACQFGGPGSAKSSRLLDRHLHANKNLAMEWGRTGRPFDGFGVIKGDHIRTRVVIEKLPVQPGDFLGAHQANPQIKSLLKQKLSKKRPRDAPQQRKVHPAGGLTIENG